MLERIDKNTIGPWVPGHYARYYLANGFVLPGDTVLDAACGTGYGSTIFNTRNDIDYMGIDISLDYIEYETTGKTKFMELDLVKADLDIEFDVFIGFETIEHLSDYTNYLALAKKARRWSILSVPVVPTKHYNPYHLHDFVPDEIPGKFIDNSWELFQKFYQPAELSDIYIFRRLN